MQVRPVPMKKKYSSCRDSPRLVNVFIYLQDEFLLRDTKHTRQEIDIKQSNDFWKNVADIYNDISITSLSTCLFLDNEIFKEFYFKYSGF